MDVSVACNGPATMWGQWNDPMVGRRIGGVNAFAVGLAPYNGLTTSGVVIEARTQ